MDATAEHKHADGAADPKDTCRPCTRPGRALPPTQGLQRNSRLLGSYRSHLVHGVEQVQLRGHTEVHVPPQEASETRSTPHGRRPPPSRGWIGAKLAAYLPCAGQSRPFPSPARPAGLSRPFPDTCLCPQSQAQIGQGRPYNSVPKPLCFRCFPSNGRDVRQTHKVPVRSEPRTRHTWGSRRRFLPPSGLTRSVQ